MVTSKIRHTGPRVRPLAVGLQPTGKRVILFARLSNTQQGSDPLRQVRR